MGPVLCCWSNLPAQGFTPHPLAARGLEQRRVGYSQCGELGTAFPWHKGTASLYPNPALPLHGHFGPCRENDTREAQMKLPLSA